MDRRAVPCNILLVTLFSPFTRVTVKLRCSGHQFHFAMIRLSTLVYIIDMFLCWGACCCSGEHGHFTAGGCKCAGCMLSPWMVACLSSSQAFLLQSTDMQVVLIGDSLLPLVVKCECAFISPFVSLFTA